MFGCGGARYCSKFIYEMEQNISIRWYEKNSFYFSTSQEHYVVAVVCSCIVENLGPMRKPSISQYNVVCGLLEDESETL